MTDLPSHSGQCKHSHQMNLPHVPAIPIHFLLECPDCENGTCDSCPLHHTWKRMTNKKGLLDQPSKHFTSVPIPYHWRVQKSSIPGAGLGLFARTHIPCGTRMGPYCGERKVFHGRVHSHNDMCYAWEVCCCLCSREWLINVHTYIHVYVCMYVCTCVCT